MDELESAILLCFNPPPDKALRDKALQYCQNVQASPDAWALALERLSTGTARPEVAFWCCQVLQETFTNSSRYPSSFPEEQIAIIRQRVLQYFSRLSSGDAGRGKPPVFLLNKVAQVLVSLIAADYPHAWPDVFRGVVLPLVNAPQIRSDSSTAMFFRVLRTLDEDVTSIRATQISETHRVISIRVKDAMRDDCIADIMSKCADFILTPIYVSQAFDVIARYVEWVDIGLVANDRILKPLYGAITSASECNARPAAAVALRATIMKRMDTNAKINLLIGLQIETLLRSIPVDYIVNGDDETGDTDLLLQTGQVEVAALVNAVALIALDILKEATKDKNATVISPQAHAFAETLAQVALSLALRFMDENAEEGTSSQTLQCVSTYVNVFAKLSRKETAERRTAGIPAITAILQVVEERSVYPRDFDPHDDESEGHRSLSELRSVLVKTIFRSVVRAFPEMCVEFVRALLMRATEKRDVARTELALAMLVILAGTASDTPEVIDLRRTVIANPPACMDFASDVPMASRNKLQIAQQHQLELISITYFDLVARSYRLFLTRGDPNLLSSVLPVFFDTRGLGHRSSEAVRSHAAYSLLKLARPLRSVVTSTHLRAVLNAAQGHLFPLNMDVATQASKNQMLIFETVGYLLGTDHKKEESMQYLSAILKPLVDSLQTSPGIAATSFISAAGYLSKGFGGDSKPLLLLTNDNGASPGKESDGRAPPGNGDGGAKEIKQQRVTPLSESMRAVWKTCLEAVLKAASPSFQVGKDDTLSDLRAKVLFFLHRMIDTIGPSILPYLEQILPQLLNSSASPLELRDVIILASQAITKFGDAFQSVAMNVYAPIVERALQVSYELDPHTLMAISEESREAVEMHRAYTYFIHALVSSKLIAVVLHPQHQSLIQPVMTSILSSAVGESLDVRVAASVMKLSLHMLGQMVERWTTGTPNGSTSEGPVGFSQFAVEKISAATVASGVRGIIFRGGDYESGQAVSVLTEIVAVQKTCSSHLGRAFAEALLSASFRSVPKANAETYVSALYSPDAPMPMLVSGAAALFKLLRKGS